MPRPRATHVSPLQNAQQPMQPRSSILKANSYQLYDPAVYRIRPDKSGICEIRADAEALKFNQLQWLEALENVYYSNETTLTSIDSQARRFLPKRSTSPPKVHRYPEGAKEPLFFLEKSDLRIRLRPSFVIVSKSKKKLLRSLREPQVRNRHVVEAYRYFEKMNQGKPWSGNDFIKFLEANGQQETGSGLSCAVRRDNFRAGHEPAVPAECA